MDNFSFFYLENLKQALDPSTSISLSTSIPNESIDHLTNRIYSKEVDIPRMLDNASHTNLDIPNMSKYISRPLAPVVIGGIKKDPDHWLNVLKQKVDAGTVRKFIEKNPHVFDQVANSVPHPAIS